MVCFGQNMEIPRQTVIKIPTSIPEMRQENAARV